MSLVLNGNHILTTTTEGDKVIVKRISRDADDGWILTLDSSQKIESHKGFIRHQEIIGRPNGTLVRSHVGAQFRVFEPSLAEYVTLSRRLVTPVRSCFCSSFLCHGN